MDIRLEKSISSMAAKIELLEDIVRSPALFSTNAELLDSLKSQARMATFKDVDRNIFSSSLSTDKRIADRCLDGGYKELDRLRRAATGAIQNHLVRDASPNSTTRKGLEKHVAMLRADNQSLRQDLLILTLILEKSFSQGMSYARRSADPRLLKICELEQRELKSMLSLCQSLPQKNSDL